MSAHDGSGPAGATLREGRDSGDEGFWLDDHAFIVFGRQVETSAVRSGTVMLLLDPRQSSAVEKKHVTPLLSEQQWLKRYCELKGNLLLYAPHSDAAFEGAFMLEDFVFKLFPPSRALAMGLIPRLPAEYTEGEHTRDSTVLVGTSRHDGVYGKFLKPLVMMLDTQRAAAAWKLQMDSCSASKMQQKIKELEALLERERAAVSREREATAVITKQQELALMESEGSKRTLLLEIERLEQRNQRLQASGEVTEKAAAEFVDQKAHEVSFLQNELAAQLAGSKRLEEEVVHLREVLSSSQQKAQMLAAENSQLNCKVADFLKDLEDARDNPSRFALLMEENISLTQNFHQLDEKFRQKPSVCRRLATLERLLTGAPQGLDQKDDLPSLFSFTRLGKGEWWRRKPRVWHLLFCWAMWCPLVCCGFLKVRFYEQGYKWSPQQEEDALEKIEELQRAIRVAEAAARSSYISHRAFLLGEQLKACTLNASQGDIYAFLKETLDRFGWLFGEVEPYLPKGADDQVVPFWRDAGDLLAPIPLREQLYPFGGLEGGPQLSLVPDVCVLRSVEKLVPAGEYLKLKNIHALLQLDFSELKETVDKLMECRTQLRDLRTQCALNQASADWRVFETHPRVLLKEELSDEENVDK
ncbi:hypothetical protein cyc_05460 [Cyclospora cayetanensis]|uniref:Uncharacterized protein n=1 Tax=Cyclospora cayetanensis TaxID=88456 RepID=A0A1D3D498_9EIME|nr:hypothetical protein cyc_05460 [Cyclospora cayetanensis]